jgi:hypothetical protein
MLGHKNLSTTARYTHGNMAYVRGQHSRHCHDRNCRSQGWRLRASARFYFLPIILGRGYFGQINISLRLLFRIILLPLSEMF